MGIRQNFISSSFWSDDWVDSLSVSEKLLYMYLLTNESTNCAGIYRITVKRIKDDTGIARGDIEETLKKFSNDKKAIFYDGFMIIPKWPKHQKLEKRKTLKLGVEAILKNLPENIKEFISQPGNYYYDLVSLFDRQKNSNKIPNHQKVKKGDKVSPKADTISLKEEKTPYPIHENNTNDDTLSNDLDLDSDLESIINLQDGTSTEDAGNPQSSPTADAVEPEAVVPIPLSGSSKPRKTRKLELSSEQLILFHAAKGCFETSEKSKMLIYQDKETTAREMKHLKTLVIRCTNMAPGITTDFLRNVLEHFKVMCNGKLKGKAIFTPRALITPWIWELVIDSLPEQESPELREIVRGLFK